MDELTDVRAALRRAPHLVEEPGLKRSAVAMVLGPERQLWLARRAERLSDPWSGHLALPGGRHDPGDADLLATALRETREEVGVDLGGAELLGQLDDVRARPVTGLMLRPFVFRVADAPSFTLNHEIAGMHVVALDDLLRGVGRGTMRWPLSAVGVTLPCVDVDGRRLWGLTLQVIDDLLDRIDGQGQGLRRPTAAR